MANKYFLNFIPLHQTTLLLEEHNNDVNVDGGQVQGVISEGGGV